MSFAKIYKFLEELQENNNKQWMDLHRKDYHQSRDWFIQWLDQMNLQLDQIDKNYTFTPGKKGINRINNNLMFHPNKPIYKDHFGAGLDQESKQGDFYIHIGVSESFIAGGYYRPGKETLQSIRDAIDYNGDVLQKILNKKSFKATFGELIIDDPLSNAPKGYTQDHVHIDLLKNKTFAVSYELNRSQVNSNHFNDIVIEVYKEMLPFRRYLNQAVTV